MREAARGRVLAAGLLFLGLTLCLAYAWDLPLETDEVRHSAIARSISLSGDSFSFPLGTRETTHPLFSVYLAALGLWAGGGSEFAARALFIALHLVGVFGVYLLGSALFGTRAGLFALALAVLDAYFLTSGSLMTEPPSCLFAVPFLLYFFYMAQVRGRARYWPGFFAAAGLGFMFYELIALFFPPLLAFVLVFGERRKPLVSGWFWGGVLLFLVLISPYLAWNLSQGGVNLERHAAMAGGWGITPRVFVLFFGDLLLCLKPSAWVLLNYAHGAPLPFYVPCFALSGLLYLGAAVRGLFRSWDKRYALLSWCFFFILAVATVTKAREGWNNFWWAAGALAPGMVLAGAVLDRWGETLWGRRAVALALAAAALWAGVLAGFPKYGLAFCPEKRFLGRMHYLASARPGESGRRERRLLAREFMETHPDSAIGPYFLAANADSGEEARKAFAEMAERDPENLLIPATRASQAIRKGDWEAARKALLRLVSLEPDAQIAYPYLAIAEYQRGNHRASEAFALRAIRRKPDDFLLYRILFFAQNAQGKREEARKALSTYASHCFEDPADGYEAVAGELLGMGRTREAGECREAAERIRRGGKGFSREEP